MQEPVDGLVRQIEPRFALVVAIDGNLDHAEPLASRGVSQRQDVSGLAIDHLLVRAQEAANSFDNEGRKEGIRQFIDDKSYKPGLGTYKVTGKPDAESIG